MAAQVATMPPSTTSHSSSEARSRISEAGPTGFTAVNNSSPTSNGAQTSRRRGQRADKGTASVPSSRETSPRGSERSSRTDTFSDRANQEMSRDGPSHKRKRSDSPLPNGQPRHYDYSPPTKSESQQHMANRALNVLDNTKEPPQHSPYHSVSYSTTPYQTENPHYAYASYRHQYNGQPASPDGRMPEGYQRDANDPSQRPPYSTSPPVNGVDHDGQSHHTEDDDRTAVIPTGQKRKRNFSNRTKTGCMTCRQRKKKCDERKPFCEFYVAETIPTQG